MKESMLELVPHVKVAELAARLKITTQSVWGLVKRGTITPPIKFGHRPHAWHAETAEQIIRTRTPDLVRYCTAAQLAARLGVTRQAVWALVRRGTVPAPLRLSVRVSVWDNDTAAEIVRARHSHTQERKNAGAVRKELRLARLKRQYAPETVAQRRAEIARLERGIENKPI